MRMPPAQQHQVTRQWQKISHLAGPLEVAGGRSSHTSTPVKIRTAKCGKAGEPVREGCIQAPPKR